jgi:hypothetical protein
MEPDDEEPEQAVESRAPVSIDEIERDELILAIREVFAANGELDGEAAVREVARAMGFQRAGSRIRHEIKTALRDARRRGIVMETDAGWRLEGRKIDDFSREQLVEALLRAMPGGWVEREEAMRRAARHLGFRRTGAAIQERFKSVIRGAIMRGLLEYDGDVIRKVRSG